MQSAETLWIGSVEICSDSGKRKNEPRQPVIDVYHVLVECRDEQEQRELFERLRQEGRKVKLLVL